MGIALRNYVVVDPARCTLHAQTNRLNAKADTERVESVRLVTGAPQSSTCELGFRLKGAAPGSVSSQTAISTFADEGRYPADVLERHAAVYLSHDSSDIRMLDQSNAQVEVEERTIIFNRRLDTRRSNDGDTFSVVERR